MGKKARVRVSKVIKLNDFKTHTCSNCDEVKKVRLVRGDYLCIKCEKELEKIRNEIIDIAYERIDW